MLRKQIDTKYASVHLLEVVEMSLKGKAVILVSAIKLNLSIDTGLLPERRDWASDLQMRKQIASNDNNLLTFAEISGMAFGIESSGVVSCPTLLPASSSDQDVLNFSSLKENLEVFYWALH